MQTKSKPALFVHWAQENNACVVGVAEGDKGLAVMLDPLEVEALILHLCQSPWRMVSLPQEGVTLH